MGHYDSEKIQKHLDSQHKQTLAELAQADWQPVAGGYFKTDIPDAKLKQVSNALTAALGSDGFDLDMPRAKRLGFHAGTDAKMRQMLVTEYAPNPQSKHPMGAEQVPVGTYLKLDEEQLQALGIDVVSRIKGGVSSDQVRHR